MTIDKNRLTPTDSADFTEMSLLRRAIPIAEVFKGRLPSRKELDDINHELGTELATIVLQRTIQQSELHGAFVKDVRGTDPSSLLERIKGLAQKFEVTVVASNLYQSGRKWGDHVDSWRSWARELGFTTESIETRADFSVAENARLIGEFLSHSNHANRIIVTYGQGTSEFRYLLSRRLGHRGPGERRVASERVLSEAPELSRVRGWINVCGSFSGARSSDRALSSLIRRGMANVSMKWQGRNPITLGETATDFPLWREITNIPSQMLVSSLVGLPVGRQVSKPLRDSYQALAKFGPNDGAVLAMDACAQPGLIVPVLGLDQTAADAVLMPMFKRLLIATAVTMTASLAGERARTPGALHSSDSSVET